MSATAINGFNPNCISDEHTIALKWPLIDSGFKAAPTANRPKGKAARPTISRISPAILGTPIPLKLKNQPIVQPIISGLNIIDFINCNVPVIEDFPQITKIDIHQRLINTIINPAATELIATPVAPYKLCAMAKAM